MLEMQSLKVRPMGSLFIIACCYVHLPHWALHIPCWPSAIYGPVAFMSSREDPAGNLLMAQLVTTPLGEAALHFWPPHGSWYVLNRSFMNQNSSFVQSAVSSASLSWGLGQKMPIPRWAQLGQALSHSIVGK